MKTICAWCKVDLGYIPENRPDTMERISHGICKPCIKRVFGVYLNQETKGDNTMTKKDYELFASELHHQYIHQGITEKELKSFIDMCYRVFSIDNPAFNPAKFTRACYGEKRIRKSIKER